MAKNTLAVQIEAVLRNSPAPLLASQIVAALEHVPTHHEQYAYIRRRVNGILYRDPRYVRLHNGRRVTWALRNGVLADESASLTFQIEGFGCLSLDPRLADQSLYQVLQSAYEAVPEHLAKVIILDETPGGQRLGRIAATVGFALVKVE
jgi:hypothetical protein